MRCTPSWVLAAAASMLIAAACQPAGPVTTPVGATVSPPPGTASPRPETVPPEPTATTTAEASPSESPEMTPTAQPSALEGEFEIGPGSFFLADPHVGLDALASYTETLTVSFDGTANGQARTWSKSYRLQHTAQPTVSALVIEASGDAETPDPAVLAEAAGAAYQRSADGTCSGRPLDPANSIVVAREPAGLLPALMGAEEAGSETANGVAANHYTFDGRAMLESGGPVTTGEVWVASDGGYVIKFLRSTTADATYFGDGLPGKMTWDYELTDINQPGPIVLPAGCQLDAPIMGDSSNVLILPRYAGFDTASSVADVVAFYKQQMPSIGWAVKSEPFEGSDRAAIEFSKGAQVTTLIVTTTENGTRVDLALTGAN